MVHFCHFTAQTCTMKCKLCRPHATYIEHLYTSLNWNITKQNKNKVRTLCQGKVPFDLLMVECEG